MSNSKAILWSLWWINEPLAVGILTFSWRKCISQIRDVNLEVKRNVNSENARAWIVQNIVSGKGRQRMIYIL